MHTRKRARGGGAGRRATPNRDAIGEAIHRHTAELPRCRAATTTRTSRVKGRAGAARRRAPDVRAGGTRCPLPPGAQGIPCAGARRRRGSGNHATALHATACRPQAAEEHSEHKRTRQVGRGFEGIPMQTRANCGGSSAWVCNRHAGEACQPHALRNENTSMLCTPACAAAASGIKQEEHRPHLWTQRHKCDTSNF